MSAIGALAAGRLADTLGHSRVSEIGWLAVLHGLYERSNFQNTRARNPNQIITKATPAIPPSTGCSTTVTRQPVLFSAKCLSRWRHHPGVGNGLVWRTAQLRTAEGLRSVDLDSAGFVLTRLYRGFPWTLADCMTLPDAYPPMPELRYNGEFTLMETARFVDDFFII